MDIYFKNITCDLLKQIEKDECILKKKIELEYKSSITKSLSHKSYYNYDSINEVSIELVNQTIDTFFKNPCKSGPRNDTQNKKIVENFFSFVENEKIVCFKIFEMLLDGVVHRDNNRNATGRRSYSSTKITEWKYQENPKYQYITCCCAPYPNHYTCSAQGQSYHHGAQFTGTKNSLQFFALTNYGRLLSNFSKPNKEQFFPSYFTCSELNLEEYYFWLPIDYIKIINNSKGFEIFDILDTITTHLYNRTTFDNAPTTLEISATNLKNDISNAEKNILSLEKRIVELNKQNDDIFAEYKMLKEIEIKYNKLSEELEIQYDDFTEELDNEECDSDETIETFVTAKNN